VSVEVTLSPAELACASTVAALRHYSSTIRGGRDAHGLKRQVDASCHYEGVCAEMAAASALGVYFPASVNSYKGADLEPDWQVRGRSRHDYELLVRPDDGDEYRYVLVTGLAPTLTVRGWLWGHECKREEWLKGHGGRPPAYFVPHGELRCIDRPTT
jgi:hypothetical protein